MSLRFWACGVIVVAGFCGVICSAAINRNVKTKRESGAPPISSVCLVTMDTQLSRVGMKGIEPLLPEGEEWGRKLREMLTHAIAGARWTLAGDLSSESATSDEQVRQSVLRVRQKYDTIAVQLKKKPGRVAKGRYTLGDEVALAPCSANADTLLFVHAIGLVETGGRKAFSVVIGGSVGILLAQARYEISIAFVDAKTGDVTGFTRINLLGGKAGKDPDKVLAQRLSEEFAKMGAGLRT